RDGDLDIITNNLNAPATVFENRTAGTHRLLVELRGSDGNAFGVGARIEVVAGGQRYTRQVSLTRGYMSAGEAMEHFGLGQATSMDSLQVTWPSGTVQVVEGALVNQWLTIREPAPSSVAKPSAAQPADTLFAAPTALGPVHQEREFDDYAVQPLLPHRL